MLGSFGQRSLAALVWPRIVITPGSSDCLFALAVIAILVSQAELIILIGLVIVVNPPSIGCRQRAVGIAKLLSLGGISNLPFCPHSLFLLVNLANVLRLFALSIMVFLFRLVLLFSLINLVCLVFLVVLVRLVRVV